MKAEQTHYQVGALYGFDQEQYPDFTLNKGGCAATVACESCILLQKNFGLKGLYPYDEQNVTFEDFNRFAMTMKPYLRPRLMGINKLSIYKEGFEAYLERIGEQRISMDLIEGSMPFEEAASCLIRQLDAGLPVPFLMLSHTDRTLEDFIWHWFLLNGYEWDEAARDDGTPDYSSLRVRVCSYGEWVWLELRRLWNTGYEKKGGMIFYRLHRSGQD